MKNKGIPNDNHHSARINLGSEGFHGRGRISDNAGTIAKALTRKNNTKPLIAVELS